MVPSHRIAAPGAFTRQPRSPVSTGSSGAGARRSHHGDGRQHFHRARRFACQHHAQPSCEKTSHEARREAFALRGACSQDGDSSRKHRWIAPPPSSPTTSPTTLPSQRVKRVRFGPFAPHHSARRLHSPASLPWLNRIERGRCSQKPSWRRTKTFPSLQTIHVRAKRARAKAAVPRTRCARKPGSAHGRVRENQLRRSNLIPVGNLRRLQQKTLGLCSIDRAGPGFTSRRKQPRASSGARGETSWMGRPTHRPRN